jgi:membrane-bound ClpP family serine protease
VAWLAVIFAGYGLVTANNSTVVATLVVCALSVSGAIFLILELNSPFQGLMKISGAPMLNALAHLGQ